MSAPSFHPQLDRIVFAYLKQKGYDKSARSFLSEAGLDILKASIDPGQDADVIAFLQELDKAESAKSWEVGYRALQTWLEQSLDVYKPELRATLWPIFVHSYLSLVLHRSNDLAEEFYQKFKSDHVDLHRVELEILAAIRTPQHVTENEWVENWRRHKYNLDLSPQGFRLFLSFLQEGTHSAVLRIVNTFINIRIRELPGPGEEAQPPIGLLGLSTAQMANMHQDQVSLYTPVPNSELSEEVIYELKQTGQTNLINLYTTQLKEMEQSATLAGAENTEQPLVPLPQQQSKASDVQEVVQALNDAAHRVAMGPGSLPSICMYTFHHTNNQLNSISFSLDTTLAATGHHDSYITLWSLSGDPFTILKAKGRLADLKSRDELDGLRETTNMLSMRLIGHSGPVYSTSFSPDTRFLLSCSEDKTIRLWSLDMMSNLVCYKSHSRPVWDVEYGPRGYYFASASADRTARLWTCEQIMPLRIFAGHLSDVECVKFHPNSRYLATGSADRSARFWDVQTGRCVRVFTGHRGAIAALAISHNGKQLATAGEDREIRLWDISSGHLITTYQGHRDMVNSLDFSWDDRVLVSGSADCTVRVWDLQESSTDNVPMMDAPAMTDSSAAVVVEEASKKDHNKRLLGAFPTKSSPVFVAQFTRRNVVIAGGHFLNN